MEFEKYDHSIQEKKIYDFWENKKLFSPLQTKNNKKFSIVIPPPNVTGRLHMGHALNNSLQDVLIRFYRMNGYETLWQPGTDHAGIATQAVVEKNLSKEGINKNEIGREKFIEKVWEWKAESGDLIISQLKKLGCSCDWSRSRFTMDAEEEGYLDGMKDEKEDMDEMKKEIEELASTLAETKLLNAKLLYSNKIFRAKNLNETQKVKVLEAFDKASSVKEAKLIYETLTTVKETKSAVNESGRGMASKAAGMAPEKKPILEVNDQFARWQILAGIKKTN